MTSRDFFIDACMRLLNFAAAVHENQGSDVLAFASDAIGT